MARSRTTKKLAQRIDLNYFQRPSAYKRAKFWLALMLPLIALVWIAWRSAAKDSRVFSSGRMSAAHAVLEKECATCHLQQAGVFSAKAADRACLACHDGPAHHPISQEAAGVKSVECAACHSEHRGRVNIVAVSNQACAQCHANLAAVEPVAAHFPAHIHSFESGHPAFDATKTENRDPGTIKLNHAIHLKPIRRGPNGPSVQLECGDCHRSVATAASAPAATQWPYADAKYVAAKPSYNDQDEFRAIEGKTLLTPAPPTGRELMAPVKFASACASCHLLTFDKRLDEGVPHDKPEVVHAFVVKKFQDYIAAHPAELRVTRDPARDLTGKPLPPEMRIVTPSQWVADRTADAEQLLWRKTCRQCHTLAPNYVNSLPEIQESPSQTLLPKMAPLPQIAPARTTIRWMPHAKFDHDAHRGFTCVSCHEKGLSSTESSDVLLSGIATCQTCHAPGPDHAESRCFECHTYHDWSQRKETTPQFTLPSLRTGGR
jgi:Cytochrome c3